MQQNALSPRSLSIPKVGRSSGPAMRAVRKSDLVMLRRMMLAYFLLWIFEGSLRKWLLPSLANPLLIIRDPFVLYIYYLAFRLKIFPRNIWVTTLLILSIYMFIAGMIVLGNTAVVLYGWRTTFLHFPLIWVISVALSEKNLRFIENWVFFLCPFMAALMLIQFISPDYSWWNVGASEGSMQLSSALGRIRPAATFSFVSGPVCFFSLAFAFLLHSQLSKKVSSIPLVIMAAIGLIAATAVSGSRTLLAGLAIILAVALIAGLILAPKLILNRPQLIARWLGTITILYIAFNLLLNIPVIQLGVETFQTRIFNASQTEGGAGGFANRAVAGTTDVIPTILESPALGYGLGLGTNVGAVLTTGMAQFTLAENDWVRIVLESGPVLGTLFVLWRVMLVCWLCKKSVSGAIRGSPLPLLIFAAVTPQLLTGNLGQATALGFVVFGSGLCLAALRIAEGNQQRELKRAVMVIAANRGQR